jgi:hypothetical protein
MQFLYEFGCTMYYSVSKIFAPQQLEEAQKNASYSWGLA